MKSIKYQIFLSSTYHDLVSEREEVIKSILELHHIPIGMEMFSAEDEDQWEIIKRTIDDSDYYILILGLRYGSKASDGISYTQKEYEYALKKKIPILAFVMKDDVPLPKEKRDDDLSDINQFRDKVLANSKMAQFWEAKDELAKNISISLMKQFRQKPSVGWVRGDSAGVSKKLSKELSALSKENRKLREKISELQSKILLKLPKINIDLNQPIIDSSFFSYRKAQVPDILRKSEIDTHLLSYITDESIEQYNRSLPTQEEVDLYNEESEKHFRIKEYSTPLLISVSNSGNVKANNIYIDIEFSDGLYVYEEGKLPEAPRSPIPFNPLNQAKIKYEKSRVFQNSVLSQLQSFNDFSNIGSAVKSLDIKNLRPINQKWWTKLEGRKITIKIENILHTRQIKFDDEYMVAPLKTGAHKIDIKIICEEYSEIDCKTIEFTI